MVRSIRGGAIAFLGALAMALTGAPAGTAHDQDRPRVIAIGLDNPRGLSFGPDGRLYVAESGEGGSGPCFDSPEGEACFGRSGAVTRIGKHGQRRVLRRLPSYGQIGTGNAATGPSDVTFRRNGRMDVSIGLGQDIADQQDQAVLDDMGVLIRATAPRGGRGVWTWRTVADLADFEDARNPTGDEENSNPNSVLATRRATIVVDAGGNDLLRVRRDGRIGVLATFPDRTFNGNPMDAVPTSVARGPDRALYVGQLTGFPFPEGEANVYRIEDGRTQVVARGFTNIMDIAFDRRGRLYVLEIDSDGLATGGTTGALIRVRKNGTQHIVMSEGLVHPGGLAIRGRHAFVSNCGDCADSGRVLRIPLN